MEELLIQEFSKLLISFELYGLNLVQTHLNYDSFLCKFSVSVF
jgi:hypothetical protein